MADSRSTIVWFDEAARRFAVKPDTLRDWIAEGRFPAPLGTGNSLFYTEAELDAIIAHGFLGRWKPASGLPAENTPPGKSRKDGGKSGKEPTKGGKDGDLEGSEE